MALPVTTTNERLTYLMAVQRVARQCGLPNPGTLVGADKLVLAAMSCVRAALDEVWHYTNWHWKKVWAHVELAEKTMWYDIDSTFEEFDVLPIMPGNYGPLVFKDYGEIVAGHPGLQLAPQDYVDSDIAQQFEDQTQFHGTPRWVGVSSSSLFLFPAPSADFLADLTAGGYSAKLPYSFYGSSPQLEGDGDLLMIPAMLNGAIEFLATGYLKAILEYPGAGQDERRGLTILRRVGARKPLTGNEEYFHK